MSDRVEWDWIEKLVDCTEDDQDNIYVALVGLIGAGKSTLTKALSEAYGVPAYYENTENPALDWFYDDMSKYAFLLQISLSTERSIQQHRIHHLGEGGVSDKLFQEDLIFTEILYESGKLTKEEYTQAVRSLRYLGSSAPRNPDVVVYLRVSPETALERIRLRGRESEKGITLEYLRTLLMAYDKWMLKLSTKFPIITIDWNEPMDSKTVVKLITEELNIRREFARVRTAMAIMDWNGSRNQFAVPDKAAPNIFRIWYEKAKDFFWTSIV